MIAKTITYTDYNNVERTETFYFNLSKAELMEMELSTTGGMIDTVQRIVEAQDTASLVEIFKDMILKSYGVKSPDGRQFMKVDEHGNPLSRAFAQTEAYSQLFMELATNDKAASDFLNGVIQGNKKDSVPSSTGN